MFAAQIKPDGVQRGIIGEVIKRFEQKGFRLVALKMTQVTVSFAAVTLLKARRHVAAVSMW